MSTFARAIAPFVAREVRLARRAWAAGQPGQAFVHLERAHVLGQASTRLHVVAHWHMLVWGLRRRSPREVLGQLVRLLGAATKTVFGLVPAGNTGGANVSPFKPMPVPPDLARILAAAGSDGRTAPR